MRTMPSIAPRTVLVAAVPVGLVLGAAVVWQSTSAAFTATTDNPGNSWQAGTVALGDSASGSALFTSTADGALTPGSTRSRCIQVDYTGNLDADIRLYVTTPESVVKPLDPYLAMTVEQGTNVPDGTTVAADCTGFTPTAPATFLFNGASTDATQTMAQLKTHADYASGLPVGTAVPRDTHLTFRITYLVGGDNAAQDAQSKATFVWEARNS
ncbi:hypothetical protein [Modestobacter sp. I12A-02662]|uniref:hypothetical protein n=1 Tax=Modestobacter sp. I12A-02662 TaxID=1730496 RepID=UPI0034DE09B2